ncbi:hypothetical protein [Pyrococcus yayanosii]|uniref:Uncharacterized protein n=1 Tax=Pyrococcus yayanosii (strain CH1 / JCM 16557) TaxID=529709 RepID=F8AGC4_PYRYC|nr:hypothetical protein [Pyrococcus yayanosii]AEH25120.1 hypothetical protein PYCH_14500 [Pyrococcus yayanosii CH1]
MLDAYLRNGELFLKEEGVDEITEETIRKTYLWPVDEMACGVGVGSEGEAIAILRKFGFELSGKTRELLPSLIPDKKGTCSICGKETRVVLNKAFIFPFERKVDSIVNEGNRLTFCMEHAFKLYSAMAYLYVVPMKDGTLKFFFDGPERELRRFKNTFKRSFWLERFSVEVKEKNGKKSYSLRVNLTLSRYHPNEAFFAVLHEFVKHLRNRGMFRDALESGRTVRAYLIYGSGQFYRERIIEGTTLERLMDFLKRVQEHGKETRWGRRHLGQRDSAVYLFYENLEIPRNKKDRSKNFLEREEFIGKLLGGRFDFVLLNRIFMERVKAKLPLPFYYHAWALSFLEVFGGDVMDVETFKGINGLGYALGKAMKGTNLERYQWELFRARGFEEFLNKLVELQAKLEISLDLRPIYENKREWKVVKAVLLNGMLNALYEKEKGVSE